MAESFKDKVEETGQKITEKATQVGHRVGEKVEEATDWAKEAAHKVGNRIDEVAQKVEHKAKQAFGDGSATSGSVSDIREHMEVFGSCGNKIGRVDHVEGDRIKLTKNDSPDGLHHLIPLSWVDRVHDHIHLNRSCDEVKRKWETA